MNDLNKLELRLLEGLVKKYSRLASHIEFLKEKKKKITGEGMMVSFEYLTSEIEFEEINALFSNGENIEINKLKKGLSYVIDITSGRIEYLEFSTYEEKWDGVFGEYKITDKIDYDAK